MNAHMLGTSRLARLLARLLLSLLVVFAAAPARAAGEQFRARFPIGTRAALASIGRGEPPSASALVVL